LLLLVLLLALPLAANAQVARGTILGTIHDGSGAVIPGVTVTIVNQNTNQTRPIVTDETGSYAAELLPVGTYRVEAELPGFKREVRGPIELHVDQKARLDLVMQVGSVQEVVEVSAAAPLVQTDDASMASTMDHLRVVELPINGRDIAQLAYLIPGASAPRSGSSLGGRGGFTIAGEAESANQLMLDGINNNGGGTHEISARVNIDAIQEFKVQTNTYGAQYGRFPGAQVDAVTKSGTNNIHGNLFYFGRNSALDARNFFDPYPDTVKPQLRRHQYGATIGGPVQKDKTFFFYGFQGQRQFQLLTKIGTLPLPQFWSGDFSKAGKTIIDPVTKQPFQGNIIPQNRISPQALQYRQFYPTATDLTTPVSNYTAHLPSPDDYRLMNGRVDHTFSPKHNVFAAYTYHHEDLTEYPIAGNPTIPDFAVDGHIYSQLLAISDVYTLSPKVINEFRIGFNRLIRVRDPLTYKGINTNAQLGITGTIADRFPVTYGVPFVNVSGVERIGDNTNIPQHNYNQVYTIVDNISWQHGRHSIKFGGDYYKKGQNTIFLTNPRGTLTFNGSLTGFGFADFILGLPSQTSRNIPGTCERCGIDFHTWITSVDSYVQDDWKVSEQLTLNLGVRYELNVPIKEKYGKLHTFNLATGQIDPPFSNNAVENLDKNNLAPRFGLAYRPFNDTKTVIRAGAGVFYGVESLCNCSFYSVNPPNFFNQTFTSDATTQVTLADPFPANRTSTSLSVYGAPKDYPTQYYTNWSFGIQRELSNNLVIETTYEGKKGSRLPITWDPNQPLAGSGAIQPRRVFQQWSTIQYQDPIGSSIYHGGSIKVEKRLSQGLSVLTNYTFSKMIDNVGSVQDSHNILSGARGLSDYHNRHRFSLSSVYQLPIGEGRQLANSIHGPAGMLISGWEINTVVQARSGQPFNPRITTDASNTGENQDRPNLVGDWHVDHPTPQQWFNPAVFTTPTTGTFGNAGRNILIGPGLTNFDFSLIKNTKVGEAANVQFRLEAFNAFNHANLDIPNAQMNTANAGRITNTLAGFDARQIQFGLKIAY
jgi:hypothetical protein